MIPEVENVILYIDDAVRYDVSKDRLADIGPTYKSIAASLHTPASFGSLLTGRHVPRHGITGFDARLSDDTFSIFDIESHNVRLSDRGGLNESIATMYPGVETGPLEAMDPPFVWVIRGPGGHAPYDGYDMETFEFVNENAHEYLHRLAGDTEKLRKEYRAGVHSGIDEFEQLLETIHSRGIAEETLVIYTSDHGELLGEYGLLGHNHVACPELVYVPTTLVHPSLEPEQREQTVRNVDILPTVLDTIEHEIPDGIDGERLTNLSGSTRGYNHYEQKFYTLPSVNISRTVTSYWDRGGGYSFVEATRHEAFLTYIGILLRSHCGKQIRSDNAYLGAFKRFMNGSDMYGSPSFNESQAKEMILNIRQKAKDSPIESVEVDREQLRDLGYI